jgi:hypothetical protein
MEQYSFSDDSSWANLFGLMIPENESVNTEGKQSIIFVHEMGRELLKLNVILVASRGLSLNRDLSDSAMNEAAYASCDPSKHPIGARFQCSTT